MADPDPSPPVDDFPPIETVALTGHLPGQNSPGPLRYTIFRDALGPIGALWMAVAPGDEAVGWAPNRNHPDAIRHRSVWRPRITVAQARSTAPDGEGTFSAEQFFRTWTSEAPAEEGVELDGPHDFEGRPRELVTHLGW
jgi:hypothetical protein